MGKEKMIFSIKNIPMKRKLITLFLIVSLIPVIIVGIWSGILSKNALLQQSYNHLESIRDIKKNQILDYYRSLTKELESLASTVQTMQSEALKGLTTIQVHKKSQIEGFFKKRFADTQVLGSNLTVINALSNFQQAFQREQRVRGSRWNRVNKQYGKWFTQYKNAYDYLDLMLVNRQGNIIYSVAKNSDLGKNLNQGRLRNTNLAQCYRSARRGTSIQDFSYYFPTKKQAMFLCQPIKKANTVIGFLVLSIGKKATNAIVQNRVGMGKTGETYLFGKYQNRSSFRSDMLTMGNGRYKVGASIAKNKMPQYLTRALNGYSGQSNYIDSAKNPVFVVFHNLKIRGLNWVIVSKMNTQEILVKKIQGSDQDYYKSYLKKMGYYDLFLIHPNGQIFYTVEKESDDQTNILTGKYKNSNLGDGVRKSLQTKQISFSDFAPYAPSNGAPAAFLSYPITFNGKITLIVAIQIPAERINQIMRLRTGMGTSGESYLVGSDKRMRSDSYLDKTGRSIKASFAGSIEQNGVDTVASREALVGKKGTKIIQDYNGNAVASSYTSLHFGKARWAIIAEIDEYEVLAPIRKITYTILIILASIALIVIFVALSIANGIANPLIKGTKLSQSIAKGDLSQNIQIKQNDEIGQLAKALQTMVAQLRNIVGEIYTASTQVLSGSNQLSESAQLLSEGATEQAASIEETSASIEQMSSNIQQNAENARQTEKLSQTAANDAKETGVAVDKAVTAMHE
ncbi:MAG: methyl-accepting chemotaxis protein, partial [bacterium]